jgi:hypothetical protein
VELQVRLAHQEHLVHQEVVEHQALQVQAEQVVLRFVFNIRQLRTHLRLVVVTGL